MSDAEVGEESMKRVAPKHLSKKRKNSSHPDEIENETNFTG